jgi:hypothetical protein
MAPRVYTVADLLVLLSMKRRTFFALKAAHQLPFLEEIQPRLGRRLRYRAAPVDRYLAGEWGQPRSFTAHKRSA